MPDEDEVYKTLLTAQGPGGANLCLVQLDDGRWGVLVNGQRHPTTFPPEELRAAARFYRGLVFPSPGGDGDGKTA
jgi:hypothetical protein